MTAKLIINGQEFEVEISDKKVKELTRNKQTGYEKVSINQYYYYVPDDSYGACSFKQEDDSSDDALYEAANYYSSKEVAENNMRADKLMRQLRRFAVLNRKEKLDWNKERQLKYFIIFNHNNLQIYDTPSTVFQELGIVYFDSKETVKKAIEEFHDELIWYFTEYKDSL